MSAYYNRYPKETDRKKTYHKKKIFDKNKTYFLPKTLKGNRYWIKIVDTFQFCFVT